MNLNEKLQRLLATASGNPFDVHLILYTEFMAKSDTPGQVLKTIIEYPHQIGTQEDNSPTLITEEDVANYVFEYFDLIEALIKNIVEKNLSSEDFYNNVYTNVFKFSLLPQDEKGQAILLFLLSAKKIPGIPYYPVTNLLIMDDEQYRQIIDKIEDKIFAGLYMLKRQFRSKTEEASQLWNLANQLMSREEQIVFWSVIIGIIRKHENGEGSTTDSK